MAWQEQEQEEEQEEQLVRPVATDEVWHTFIDCIDFSARFVLALPQKYCGTLHDPHSVRAASGPDYALRRAFIGVYSAASRSTEKAGRVASEANSTRAEQLELGQGRGWVIHSSGKYSGACCIIPWQLTNVRTSVFRPLQLPSSKQSAFPPHHLPG
ncbi:hypothetical protein AWZ03_013484 [Drosophila navojoa]|uniref:Uncharacterized protein n=1 Tax=Drosophila navojoa TaxID=7232 RepID=A0A484AUL2_DRONA|nr:hypothetical protein AWZ03_013484 [Drosophila navojoa]